MIFLKKNGFDQNNFRNKRLDSDIIEPSIEHKNLSPVFYIYYYIIIQYIALCVIHSIHRMVYCAIHKNAHDIAY